MKTFYERFLDEVQRRLEAGEITQEKAQLWIAEIKTHLKQFPGHPLAEMPVEQ